jgi:hypothetical protein
MVIVVELVDTIDCGSIACTGVGVQVPSITPICWHSPTAEAWDSKSLQYRFKSVCQYHTPFIKKARTEPMVLALLCYYGHFELFTIFFWTIGYIFMGIIFPHYYPQGISL